MRGAPQGSHRSVDRGTCRPGIELRNQGSPACRRRFAPGRLHRGRRFGESPVNAAQSETPRMYGNSTRENREIPEAPMMPVGRSGKATSQTPDVHVSGKSDGRVVPAKEPNKGDKASLAEVPEGRRSTKENMQQRTPVPGAAPDMGGSSRLPRVREVARQDKRKRFTTLLHHVTVPLLKSSFFALKREASPGVDG